GVSNWVGEIPMVLRRHPITRLGLGVLAAPIASLGFVAAAPAGAAEPIEEVVVSARRTAESLSDVPISVTAFTSAQIEDAGIQRPEDFIALTPNVSLVDTANTGDTQVTIRGITSTR